MAKRHAKKRTSSRPAGSEASEPQENQKIASTTTSPRWQPGQPVGNARLQFTPPTRSQDDIEESARLQAQFDKEFAAATFADPLRFCKLCWPDMKLYDKQAETILSVRENKQTYVHAAHAMGKSRLAAITAIWWFCSRSPAKVIATSSSERQLRDVLWAEIRLLTDQSAVKLPLEVMDLEVRKLNPDFPHASKEQYLPGQKITGQVAGKVESFQGHHLPNDRPRVLLLFEEASSIDDELKVAGDSWAHHELIIGNPISVNNFFYRDCKAGDAADPSGEAKLARHVIHIDGQDSPNVRLGMRLAASGHKGPWPLVIPGLLSYPEYLIRNQEWDEVAIRTRLRGLFYEGADALLFPMTWLDRAQGEFKILAARFRAAIQAGKPLAPRKGRAMGIDVAMGGRDDTVWTIVDEFGVLEQIILDTPNTMEIPGRTINLMKKHGMPAGNVAIDMGGGKPIFDRLAEQGYHIHGVHFGGAAGEGVSDPKKADAAKKAYKNKRAELYGTLREFLDPSLRPLNPFVLPDSDHLLRQELAILPIMYDSDSRLVLPPKDRPSGGASGGSGGSKKVKTIKEMLGGRSPDRADSLALAAWVAKHGVATEYWTVSAVEFAKDLESRAVKMAIEVDAKVKEMMRKMEMSGELMSGGFGRRN